MNLGDTVKFVSGAVLAASYVAGLVVLVWHGSISGGDAIGAAGAVVLPVIGAAIHGSGVAAVTQNSSGK